MAMRTVSALIVLATFQGVIADNGYANTCNSMELEQPGWNKALGANNVIFSGDCQTLKGGFTVDTVININKCFAYNNGQLVAQSGGNFGASCNSLSLSGTTMHATCTNTAGNGQVSTSIDLNNYIGNNNGLLTCFGSTPLKRSNDGSANVTDLADITASAICADSAVVTKLFMA